MTNTTARLDDEISENIRVSMEVSRCLVLVGVRQFDRFLLADCDAVPRILTLERICHDSIGSAATWTYDPARRKVALARAGEAKDLRTVLPTQPGESAEIGAAEAIAAFAAVEGECRFVLVMDAGLLFADPQGPHGDDFRLLQAIERFARDGDRSRILVLRVPRASSLPAPVQACLHVRTVHIAPASRDVRHAYACRRGESLASQCGAPLEALADSVSRVTDDWTLEQVDGLLQMGERQQVVSLPGIEELARAIRVGTTHSPWAGERIRLAVKGAGATLSARVTGQPAAVGAVSSALRKAVVGLSSAHQSQGSQAPRAVFFFAGPTGTGKTELAKALSQLVFGQEQLLRFDCGELRQEHAVSRLIGAPPGYVGYDRGGELTEGIRAKPNSVVLFDEIEKAHPRLLDTLLGVLDDGRLTSGQGETSHFGQALLIFTSNLGMYEEVAEHGVAPVRRPRFGYDTPFDVIERRVRDAIREEFVSGLGRPELLGRFGGAESIIVFDYLRDLEQVCRKFIANIAAGVERLHGIGLTVDVGLIAQAVRNTQERPDSLVLGGRGLKPELDRLLTDPLANYLFDTLARSGTLHARLVDGKTVFDAGSA